MDSLKECNSCTDCQEKYLTLQKANAELIVLLKETTEVLSEGEFFGDNTGDCRSLNALQDKIIKALAAHEVRW